MTIAELSVKQKCSLIRNLLRYVDKWRKENDDFEVGLLDVYDSDKWWLAAKAVWDALIIICGHEVQAILRDFMVKFGEMTDSGDSNLYDEYELLLCLAKAFDADAELLKELDIASEDYHDYLAGEIK